MKAYIVSDSENGIDDIDGVYYLITEEGECLASHWCSNKGYAMGDLYSGRPERVNEWTERFGDFTVEYLECSNMTMEKLIELNCKRQREHEEC